MAVIRNNKKFFSNDRFGFNTLSSMYSVLLVIAKHDKTKKRHKRTLWGKSDWEKTCDDGGKFFGW